MTISYFNEFTKVFSKEINLVKPIADEDILLVYGDFKKLYIIDRNEFRGNQYHYDYYYNNSNLTRTEFLEPNIRFYSYTSNYIIYPYINYKTIEEMKNEEIGSILRTNYFIIDGPKNYKNAIFIAKLEKQTEIDGIKYYITYYVSNNIINNIKLNKKDPYIPLLIKVLSEQKSNEMIIKSKQDLQKIINTIPEYNMDIQQNISNGANDLLRNNVSLYNYQKRDVIWMQNIENSVLNNLNKIDYEYSNNKYSVLNNEFFINNYNIYNNIYNNEIYNDCKDEIVYQGGNLISEVGLGKTLIMLYHILNDNKKTDYYYSNYVEFNNHCNYFYKRGKNKGINCMKKNITDLFCKEHKDTVFVDKRSISYKNLDHFDIKNYFYVYKNREYIKTNASIIICPNHLCDQWVQEYYSKFNGNHKIVLIVTYDQYINVTLGDILFADIVIISYNFLINKKYKVDFSKNLDVYFSKNSININEEMSIEKKTSLLNNNLTKHLNIFYWNRVVLDEVHEIQNMINGSNIKTQIQFLKSIYKWNISGTPFPNNIESFINLMSFNTNYGKAFYNINNINKSLYNNNNNNNNNKLYVTSDLIRLGIDSDIINKSAFLFRRNTKESIKREYNGNIISENVHLLKFTKQERGIYDSYVQGYKNKNYDFLIKLCCHSELNNDTKQIIKNCKTFEEIQMCLLDYNKQLLNKEVSKIRNFETEINEYQSNLEKIKEPFTELEQEYVNGIKIKLNNVKRQLTITKKNHDNISRTYNYLKISINKLKNVDEEELTCPICLDDIDKNSIAITKCGHKFCWECIYETHQVQHNKDNKIKCPTCNTYILNTELYLLDENTKEIYESNDINSYIEKTKSTKIGSIVYFLKNSIKKDDKVILFSQWDEMLHKVGDMLTNTNLKIVYCKGTVYQRKRAISNFFKNDDVNVILLSSRNAASGINLTIANKIILLEPIYGNKEYRDNIESQAIGRADRLGQKRPINIHRFIIKDTIEQDIYNNCIDDTKIRQLSVN